MRRPVPSRKLTGCMPDTVNRRPVLLHMVITHTVIKITVRHLLNAFYSNLFLTQK